MAIKSEGENRIKLYGLILTGGKSTRMGRDKGQLDYHGLPQRNYLFSLAANCCEKVFYSIREDQTSTFDEHPYIVDRNKYKGPTNGILSAYEKYPDIGWLVLACDLPLLQKDCVNQLIAERDTSKLATVFATKQSKLPEPLIAIWEPKGLKQFQKAIVNKSVVGPRKFLEGSDIKIIYPLLDNLLYNANSEAEYKKAKTLLNS